MAKCRKCLTSVYLEGICCSIRHSFYQGNARNKKVACAVNWAGEGQDALEFGILWFLSGDCSIIWFHFRPAHQLLPSQRPGVRKRRWLSGEFFPPITGRSKMTSIHKNVKSFRSQESQLQSVSISFRLQKCLADLAQRPMRIQSFCVPLVAAFRVLVETSKGPSVGRSAHFFRWGKAGKS